MGINLNFLEYTLKGAYGGDGNDHLDATGLSDDVPLFGGNCTLIEGAGSDILSGGNHNDNLDGEWMMICGARVVINLAFYIKVSVALSVSRCCRTKPLPLIRDLGRRYGASSSVLESERLEYLDLSNNCPQ